MADISIHVPPVAAIPARYTVAGNQEIIIKGVTASFDGTGAAGAWVPAVQIVDPSGVVVGTYTCDTTLTAGASADVSWFPSVGGIGSGGSGGNTNIYVVLDTPDSAANGFPFLTYRAGFNTVRYVLPTFVNGADGAWYGRTVIPSDYVAGAKISLYLVANATSGNVKTTVATSAVAAGSGADAAYTSETTITTSVPGTANQLFTVTSTLTPVFSAGQLINVRITRGGSTDTCTALLQALACVFGYVN